MSDVVRSSLRSAVKGTTLIILGTALSNLLWFGSKVIIVRSMTPEEFGIYMLALAMAGVLSAIAIMGLQEGSARFISTYLGEDRKDMADAVSRSALHVALVSGTVAFVLLFAFSGPLSRHVFYKPEVAGPFRVISLSIPFTVMAGLMVNILRGYGIIRPKVYYQDVGQPLYFLLLVAAAFLLELSYMSVVYAFTIAIALVFVSVSAYAYKKTGIVPMPLRGGGSAGELIRFSLPLMLTGFSYMVLSWTDTLMLGRYTPSADVGVYNVSVSLSKLLTIPLTALYFIFMPLAGEMYGRKQMSELKRTYQVLTKWLFAASLPIFFVLFFFPEMTIYFLFGEGLEGSALPLQIMSAGFLFHAFLGANSLLLIVLGLPKTVMNISLGGALLNVALNYVLIKRLGLNVMGAAAATLVSYSAITALYSYVLYIRSGLHPITKQYVKPVAGSAIFGLVMYVAAKSLPLYLWMMPLYLILFIGGYLGFQLITRSIDEEDVALVEAISEKTGIEMKAIKGLMSRFARPGRRGP